MIQKRDEFTEDIDFVIKWSAAYYIRNSEAGHCRRYLVDLEGEKIMTNLDEIMMHDF